MAAAVHAPINTPAGREPAKIGEPFNPWREACGFYPPEIVGRISKQADGNDGSRMAKSGFTKDLFDSPAGTAGAFLPMRPWLEHSARAIAKSEPT